MTSEWPKMSNPEDIKNPEKNSSPEKKLGLTQEELDKAAQEAGEKRELVYLQTPLGKATLDFRNNDAVMVNLLNLYGESTGSSLLELKDIKLINEPDFLKREYIKPETSQESGSDEEDSHDPYQLAGEERIISTDGGEIKGKIIFGYKGGPGVIQTEHGKIKVDELM